MGKSFLSLRRMERTKGKQPPTSYKHFPSSPIPFKNRIAVWGNPSKHFPANIPLPHQTAYTCKKRHDRHEHPKKRGKADTSRRLHHVDGSRICRNGQEPCPCTCMETALTECTPRRTVADTAWTDTRVGLAHVCGAFLPARWARNGPVPANAIALPHDGIDTINIQWE